MLIFMYCMLLMRGNPNQHFALYTIYLFPFMNIDIIPGIHSMSILEVSVILFGLLFYKPHTSKTFKLRFTHVAMFVLLGSISIGSSLAENNSENSLKAIIQLGSALLYSKIIFDELVIDHLFMDKILKAIRAVIIFSFIFMAIQLVFGSGISLSKSENINVAGGETLRFPSFFQDPQKYAQFLSMAGLMMFIPLENDKKWLWLKKILPYLACAAIFMTGSRAALGGMIIGFSYIFWKRGKSMSFIFILLLAGIILITVGSELPIFKRASLTESYDFRNDIWNDAIEIYKSHPIWGIGAGNYADYVRIHNPDQFWMGDNEMTFFDHPESGYLKILVEYGTAGFTSMIALILIPLFQSLFLKDNIHSVILAAVIISWLIGFYTLYSIGDIRISMMVVLATCLLINQNQQPSYTHNPSNHFNH